MSEWWNGLLPYQREIRWTAIFGLLGMALFGVAVFVIWLVRPELLTDPEYAVAATAVGAVWGLVSGLGGMLLGYRMEDRHADKLRARGEKYRV